MRKLTFIYKELKELRKSKELKTNATVGGKFSAMKLYVLQRSAALRRMATGVCNASKKAFVFNSFDFLNSFNSLKKAFVFNSFDFLNSFNSLKKAFVFNSFDFLNSFNSLKFLLLPLLAACLAVSCVDEDEYDDSPNGNFEALWKILDEHYCFFDYKKEAYGLDWDEVYLRYSKQVDGGMGESQLFEVLGNMLGELRDGHVNMYASFDQARYWSWHEDYPANFSDSLLRRYLGTDYKIASGLKYRKLDDNIGYIYCGSFENSIGSGNLDDILFSLATCNALIIDVRDNGGGLLTSAEKLAGRFTDEELLVGYMQHKTGTGHNDFSSMEEQKLKPSSGIRWHKKVAVLTNRSVFSAANEFVKYMKCCPNVTVVGDKTGGGAGLPFSSELPNGWSVRFSACPMYDRDKNSTEFGIEPDYDVEMTDEDFQKGKDTIIEFARKILNSPEAQSAPSRPPRGEEP